MKEFKSWWEKSKKKKQLSILDNIPFTYPAYLEANKIQKKVASVGFDYKKKLDAIDKISEELEELKEAIDNEDIKEVADALTDILYVTYGAGHAFGINLDKCFQEVQSSNMSKLGLDGKPIYNDKGKVMKGPNYFKPDLGKFVT